MPSPSPSQRIDALQQDLIRLSATVGRDDAVNLAEHTRIQERIAMMAAELATLRDKLSDAEKKVVAHEERVKALEKGTDRSWQFAPMVISGIGVVIALVALLVKK